MYLISTRLIYEKTHDNDDHMGTRWSLLIKTCSIISAFLFQITVHGFTMNAASLVLIIWIYLGEIIKWRDKKMTTQFSVINPNYIEPDHMDKIVSL